MKKKAGVLWILAGVVLALVAGGVSFYTVLRAGARAVPQTQPEPKSQVLVALRAIPLRGIVDAADVTVRTVPTDIAPANALRDPEDAIGKMVAVPLAADEVVLASDLISPTLTGPNYALTMDETRVAMAIPVDDIMSRNNLLKPGDHIDILFSFDVKISEGEDEKFTSFDALQNLEIAAVVRTTDLQAEAGERTGLSSAPPLALILTLDPQDALVLKNLLDRQAMLDIVLRSPDAEDQFPVTPVNEDYIIERYQLGIPLLP